MLQNLSVPKKLILSFMAVIAACGAATLIVLWCVASLQRADAADTLARGDEGVGPLDGRRRRAAERHARLCR